MVRSNSVIKKSVEVVEDMNFLVINNSNRVYNEIRFMVNWCNVFFFLIGVIVRVFESLIIEINEKIISDIKVVVNVKLKVKSRLMFGLINMVLNNDVNVLFIIGDNYDVVWKLMNMLIGIFIM